MGKRITGKLGNVIQVDFGPSDTFNPRVYKSFEITAEELARARKEAAEIMGKAKRRKVDPEDWPMGGV